MAEQFKGRVIRFDQLYEAASEADIVISSTGAPHPDLPPEHGQAFLHRRRNRPMFFIDIAVPRDVDPEMNKLDGIFVYDIDDLQQVAAAHMEERSREAGGCGDADCAEVERFHQRQRTVNAAPAIVALQQQAEEIRLAEIERVHARLGTLTRGADGRGGGADTRTGEQVSASAHAGVEAGCARRRLGASGCAVRGVGRVACRRGRD